MRALDLFSGMGWGIACERLHIHECGADNHPDVIATRHARHMCTPYQDVSVLPGDIAAGYDLLIASPPCQTFSIAGTGEGRRNLAEVRRRALNLWESGDLDRTGGDPRTWLVLEPLRIALASWPRYIAWEQVPAVLPFFTLSAELFADLGYSTWTGLVRAEQYGVPQVRKRAIMLARNDGQPAQPPPATHSRYYPATPARMDDGVLPWVSMASALGWGMTARPSMTVMSGGTDTGGAEPFGHAARQGMAREHAAGRWAGEEGNQAPRRISVTEAAALQTFPAGLQIAGRTGKQFAQIGNAVPPLMGQAILAALVPAITPLAVTGG